MTERSCTRFTSAVSAGGLLAISALAVASAAAVLSASPLTLARSVLPQTAPVGATPTPDRMLVAAATGGLGRHMRLARLSAGDGAALLSGRRAIAIGDRISIAGRDGAKRDYAVAAIKEIEVPVGDVADHGPPSRLLLVVAHDVASPGARPLRFIVEAEREAPPPTPASHHQAL